MSWWRPRAGQQRVMGGALASSVQFGGRSKYVPVLFCTPGRNAGRGRLRLGKPLIDSGRQLPGTSRKAGTGIIASGWHNIIVDASDMR